MLSRLCVCVLYKAMAVGPLDSTCTAPPTEGFRQRGTACVLHRCVCASTNAGHSGGLALTPVGHSIGYMDNNGGHQLNVF